MLNFEQWLEVEKVVVYNKTIEEQMKDCWNYSAQKTKEDVEESVIDEYEDRISELDSENGILESDNDELSEKCDELENIIAKVRKIIVNDLDEEEIDDLKKELNSALIEIDDYC